MVLLSFTMDSRYRMTAHQHLRLKTYSLIAVMIIAGPVGNILLGKGMKRVGAVTLSSLPDIARTLDRVFTTPVIWLGILSLLTFFVANTVLLSWADYSFVQPASAMGYAVVAVLGYVVLGEHITVMRCCGIAVICLGVLFVGQTHPRTTEPR
jgi:drug/metabolite transporter (DMT)-like permease